MEKTTLTILLVEDNPSEAMLLSEYLRHNGARYEFDIVNTQRLDLAMHVLAEKVFDAVLLDLSLPDSVGIQTVDTLREAFPLVPVVVLTGNDDEAVAFQAVNRGVQDYLVKSQADAKTLLRSVHYAMERKKHEEAIIRINERLEADVFARTAELQAANERLQREIADKIKAEQALSKRQEVLESIYAIETSFSASLESACEQIVLTIANIIGVPYAALGETDKNKFKTVYQVSNGVRTLHRSVSIASHPCGIAYKSKKITHHVGNLAALFPENMNGAQAEYRSYLSVPILSKEGRLLSIICVMDFGASDFEEQDVHLIEIFARYIGHELEHILIEDQLRASHEMNLLGRLASGVAHEVRNPLNGILAISEALFQDLGNNPEYMPYLKHIKDQVHRLSALMNDLLDLGKPMQQTEFTAMPVQLIVRTIVESFKQFSRHKERTIEVAYRGPVNELFVRADTIKIQQVFFNLLENACDHSPDNTPVVLEAAESDELYALLRIIDRGTGVAADLIPRVFEPFFTTRKGGTGLGLSIVKHIVEMHGGTIGIYNNIPGPGLTAEVRLPLVNQTAEPSTAIDQDYAG